MTTHSGEYNLKAANIAEINCNFKVEGREVKLLVCGDPAGVLSNSTRFMVGVSVWPTGPGPAPHEHEAEELYVVLEGSGEVYQGGETRKVERGSVIFHPSNVKHGIVAVYEPMTLLFILSPGGQYPHKPSQ